MNFHGTFSNDTCNRQNADTYESYNDNNSRIIKFQQEIFCIELEKIQKYINESNNCSIFIKNEAINKLQEVINLFKHESSDGWCNDTNNRKIIDITHQDEDIMIIDDIQHNGDLYKNSDYWRDHYENGEPICYETRQCRGVTRKKYQCNRNIFTSKMTDGQWYCRDHAYQGHRRQ